MPSDPWFRRLHRAVDKVLDDFGQPTHVGKSATFGLGGYRIGP